MKIVLQVSKSIEENASVYFEKAKKNHKKVQGAVEALEKHQNQLSTLLKKQQRERHLLTQEKSRKERKRQWFEKFRWFYTSEDFLVVGGRDATTNEVIIKKHTEKDDFVFHTDKAGSPFFVLKAQGNRPTPVSIREVADATCTFSRTWKEGLSTTPTFYVNPDQVTKKAQSGEYLTKGAFMIEGKTTYVDNQVNLGIGKTKDFIMAGPVHSVKTHCSVWFELVQGNTKASAVAKKIKNTLDADVDDIIRALPAGEFKIKKQH